MRDVPTITHLAPNFTQLVMGHLTIWFSYKTMIGFQLCGKGKMVSENHWSATTGKHLNQLEPDKKRRVPLHDLHKAWQEQTEGRIDL